MRQTLSVGDVAARVDVAVSTLRNWDRRYGVGPSIRTPGGHRRYTLDDLALIERMQVLVSSGMSAGRAAALARKLLGAKLTATQGALDPPEPLIERIYQSALSLDADRLRRDVDDLLHNRLAVEAWDDVLLPACRQLRSDETAEGLGNVAAHLLETLALSVLRARAHRTRPPGRPRVVLVGIGTEETKLPLAALDAALCEAGVVTTVLGSVLAAREIHAYLDRVDPVVVCQWAVKGDVDAHRYCDRSGRTVVRGGPGWSAESESCATLSAAMDRIVGHPQVHSWRATGPRRLPHMTEKHVVIEIDGPIARVWLNRPDKLNGITFDLLQGLMDAAAEIDKNREVRVVLLEGRGPSFCAGLDFGQVMTDPKRMKTWFIPNLLRGTNRFQEPLYAWQRLSVPVIAITRGHVFGGGIQLALSADFRFTTPDCQWSVMEAKWGLVPDMSGSVALVDHLRSDVAKQLVMTGELFDGTQAVEYGVATGVSDDPEKLAMELVDKLLERSPDSVAASKDLLNRVRRSSVRRAFAVERRLQAAMLRMKNTAIAKKAGTEKTKPNFEPRTFDR